MPPSPTSCPEDPPIPCHHCGEALTTDLMIMECIVLPETRGEYFTADSFNTFFETIHVTCIVEFPREAGLFYRV